VLAQERPPAADIRQGERPATAAVQNTLLRAHRGEYTCSAEPRCRPERPDRIFRRGLRRKLAFLCRDSVTQLHIDMFPRNEGARDKIIKNIENKESKNERSKIISLTELRIVKKEIRILKSE